MSHTATTNPLNSYSSFFSSGLLAPHTPRLQRRDTVSSDFSESSAWDSDADTDSFSPTSPSPSSPIALPDESMMDVDMSEFVASTLRNRERRSATPTLAHHGEGQTTPMQQSPQSSKGAVALSLATTSSLSSSSMTTTTTTAQPRLRRRRSSLTQATSPMNAIRSPVRAAGNALHHHLQIVPTATSRSRSGSLSLGDAMGATYGSSLVGRMRSGSCSDSTSSVVSSSSSSSGSKVLASSSFRYVSLSLFEEDHLMRYSNPPQDPSWSPKKPPSAHACITRSTAYSSPPCAASRRYPATAAAATTATAPFEPESIYDSHSSHGYDCGRCWCCHRLHGATQVARDPPDVCTCAGVVGVE